MENIKISVIIPVYNEEDYLEECLDSVLAQTLKEIEVICVDDGSTDNSARILVEYAKKDPRIIVLKQNNQYAGTARNLGMRNASGKYFSFLDADDIFSPFLLEKMYLAAEMYSSDVVICNFNYYDTQSGRREKGKLQDMEISPQNPYQFCWEDIPEQLLQISRGWAWDKLFLADFVKQYGLTFSKTRTANDAYFVCMALARANRITKIDDYLVTQRINNKNSLSNTREKSWYCGFQMLDDIKKGLEDANLYEQLEKTFLNFTLDYLIWSLENMEPYAAKEKIYEYIRKECEPKFKISNFPAGYYYDLRQYKEYLYIKEHLFVEYMIEKKNKELEAIWQGRYSNLCMVAQEKIWPFPYSDIEKNSKIILYGAGKVGQDYYRQVIESDYCKIILWIDQKFKIEKADFAIQEWRDDLSDIEFDRIIIALRNINEVNKIGDMLKRQGISEKKIIWKI